MAFFKGVGGSSLRVPFRAGLAHGRVRFVGEPVALVVAETDIHGAGRGRADRDRIRGPAGHRRGRRGRRRSAPSRCTTDVPDNLAFDYEYGNRESTEPGFAEPRMSCASSCTRSASPAIRWSRSPASRIYDAASEALRALHSDARARRISRPRLSQITGLAPEKFRIRSIDVGGGFGVRNEIYPEFLAVMLAAKRTGRPVKWTGTRSETISGDHHARAADLIGELALDATGRFLALRVQWLVNLGAYCSAPGR